MDDTNLTPPDDMNIGLAMGHLQKRNKELEAEIERLNQMLRETGYGQGAIDAYVAQCEDVDRLREQCDRAMAVQNAIDWCVDKAYSDESRYFATDIYGTLKKVQFHLRQLHDEIAAEKGGE